MTFSSLNDLQMDLKLFFISLQALTQVQQTLDMSAHQGTASYAYYILTHVTNETDVYLLLESLLLYIQYLAKCGSF
jgi:hypothetical protein